jgi:hypothetical protein
MGTDTGPDIENIKVFEVRPEPVPFLHNREAKKATPSRLCPRLSQSS